MNLSTIASAPVPRRVRRFFSRLTVRGLACAAFAASGHSQTILLYENDYETPNATPVLTCGLALDQRGINFLYGTPQATYQQQHTVEVVLLNYADHGHRWYSDPAGTGGNYCLGMLSSVEADQLSLTFQTQGRRYLNIAMDITSLDVLGCGGPFGIADPRYRLSLFDSPGGSFAFGTGTLLDEAEITGPVGPAPYTCNWSRHVVALDTAGSIDGNVSIVWDLLQSGYAAFDNLIITASNVPGDLSNDAPAANAGADRTVDEGSLVQLDGLGSSDPENDPLSYQWVQVAGPSVVLMDPLSATPWFTAPIVMPGGAVLTFQLVVGDGALSSEPDTVDFTVRNLNQVPIADAGADQTVSEGSTVTLHGSASFDPDGDALSFTWTQIGGPLVLLSDASAPEASFVAPLVGPSGAELEFQLVVADGSASSAPATTRVTVVNENQLPIADAGADQSASNGSIVMLDGSGSSDPDGEPLLYAWTQLSGPAVLLGDATGATPSFAAPSLLVDATLEFELVVSDGIAFSAPSSTSVLVLGMAGALACDHARSSQDLLWPPNHKMIPIEILGVTDPSGAPVQIAITHVTQDEPTLGLGDGDTGPDAVIQGRTVLLRAERWNLGNGRVYHVHFTATSTGGACSGTVTVGVPHDKHRPCVDGGPLFVSTGGT